jgi:hypothetical protein
MMAIQFVLPIIVLLSGSEPTELELEMARGRTPEEIVAIKAENKFLVLDLAENRKAAILRTHPALASLEAQRALLTSQNLFKRRKVAELSTSEKAGLGFAFGRAGQGEIIRHAAEVVVVPEFSIRGGLGRQRISMDIGSARESEVLKDLQVPLPTGYVNGISPVSIAIGEGRQSWYFGGSNASLGRNSKFVSDAAAAFSKHCIAIEEAWQAECRTLLRDYRKELQLDQTGSGPIEFKELPAELQHALESQVEGSYKALGFPSTAAALAVLRSGQARFRIGVEFVAIVRVSPSAVHGVTIGSIPP